MLLPEGRVALGKVQILDYSEAGRSGLTLEPPSVSDIVSIDDAIEMIKNSNAVLQDYCLGMESQSMIDRCLDQVYSPGLEDLRMLETIRDQVHREPVGASPPSLDGGGDEPGGSSG